METTNNKPNVLRTQVGGDHYAKYPIQPIEYIQANHLDFAQGNIVKLATRFRDKGGAEDLRKIKQYADIMLALEYGEDSPRTLPESQPIATGPQGGIYLVYADGHAELFNGENAKRNVTYVGVVFRGHRFGVSLTETTAALLPEGKQPTKRTTYKTECESIYDFDSAGNTTMLVEDNPELANCLKPGEAIPALGVLVIMCHLREYIDCALEYVGSQQLTGGLYWSSTEHSEYNAWFVGFSTGSVYNDSKCSGYAVRAVAAF